MRDSPTKKKRNKFADLHRGYTIHAKNGVSPASSRLSPEHLSTIAIPLALFCFSEMLFLSRSPTPTFLLVTVALVLSAVIFLALSRRCAKSIRRALRFTSASLLALSFGILTAYVAGSTTRAPSEALLERYGNSDKGAEIVARIDKVISAEESYGIYDGTIILANGDNTKEVFGSCPRARISAFGNDPHSVGDVIAFSGTLSAPERTTKDGFEQRRYLESREIFISCDASSVIRLVAERTDDFTTSLRALLSQGLSEYIDNPDAASLARCLLLGEKDTVNDEITDTFRASGASHILCVSGMHLTILFYVLSMLLHLGQRKRRRFPLSELISCLIALLYMAITDFTPSIMRAGFMLILANVFSAFVYCITKLKDDGADDFKRLFPLCIDGKPSKAPHLEALPSLLGAVAVISAVSPYSLFDIGMQLSFLSTLGIIVSIPLLNRITSFFGLSPISVILSSFVLTLFAISFTYPVIVYNFKSLSTMSLISNLVLSPLVTLLLVLLLLLSLLSLIPSFGLISGICAVLGKASGFLCSLCIDFCDRMGRFEFSVIRAEASTVTSIIFAVLVILAFIFCSISKRRLSSLFGSLTVCLYLVCFALCFVSTVKESQTPYLRLHTVAENPYVCLSIGKARLFLDCGSGAYSSKHISDSKGESLYVTDSYYIQIPTRDTNFEYLGMNLSLIGKESKIRGVILPSPKTVMASGADFTAYREFVRSLSQKGYPIGFYDENFTACNLEFTVNAAEAGSVVLFDSYAFIFAKNYDERYASEASENSEYCICFCKNAKETENTLYTSDAELFVTSSVHKRIVGARAIPSGSSELFSVFSAKETEYIKIPAT